MPPSKHQLHIVELLRAASLDESRFDNPMLRREHSPVARLKAVEKLLRIQGGIGSQTQRTTKKITGELEAIVKARLANGEFSQADYDEFVDRLETVKVRLSQMSDLRARKREEKRLLDAAMNPSDEERRKLLDEAHPPFKEPNACEWYREIVKGQVVWTLAVPFEPFSVIRTKELENAGTISTEV